MCPEKTSIREEPNQYVTEHFRYSDFRCPCCSTLKIVPGFYAHLRLLERMRRELGFPIAVNSGYRCEHHNREVGGAAHSWHLLFATDIRPVDGSPAKLAAMHRAAERLDFGGIGRYDTFLHLDLRPDPARWRG
ncbi:MAG: YcbK family protein [Candidatus Latescibacterota bacterium]